jgi:hypothetical protein
VSPAQWDCTRQVPLIVGTKLSLYSPESSVDSVCVIADPVGDV